MNTQVKPKKRILVVDDDPGIPWFLKINLERTNDYIVKVETHGSEALRAAEAFAPDLILLDVMMPEPDGGQLAEMFSARPKLKHIPIVFLTAAVKKDEVASHGGRVGGLRFIAKPASLQEVIDCIEAELKIRESGAGGHGPVA